MSTQKGCIGTPSRLRWGVFWACIRPPGYNALEWVHKHGLAGGDAVDHQLVLRVQQELQVVEGRGGYSDGQAHSQPRFGLARRRYSLWGHGVDVHFHRGRDRALSANSALPTKTSTMPYLKRGGIAPSSEAQKVCAVGNQSCSQGSLPSSGILPSPKE